MSETKRARKVLSIKDKVQIIHSLKVGSTVKTLAKKYGVGEQTLYDLRKNQDKILKFYAESDAVKGLENRKALKTSENPQVDKATYEWFRQERFQDTPISGNLIIEKAKEFHEKLNIRSACQYSQGWLGKFKNRHGIHSLKTTGEKLSADYIGATMFVDELSNLIEEEDLSPEQIYNADETGVFWKLLPKRTLASNDERSAEGLKESKERITVLSCSNAAGTHKCKLLVIGKSARPRAFKNNTKNLPVIYKANRRAWVTQEIFLQWFNNDFVPEAKNHLKEVGLAVDCKILLLLDNCPAHPVESAFQRENVIVKFLPPNCTSLIQPQDQGIIRSLKCHYRKHVMRKFINNETNLDLCSFQKSFNIKNAIWCLFNAWEDVTSNVLKNTWGNILLGDEAETPTQENEVERFFADIPQSTIGFSYEEISDWIESDHNAPIIATLSDDEIVNTILNPQNEVDSDVSDTSCEEVPQKTTISQAITACTTLINFLEDENCEGITIQDTMQLYRIQDKLLKNKQQTSRQTTINDFFGK